MHKISSIYTMHKSFNSYIMHKRKESYKMTDGAKKSRNEYFKKWRKEHPDRVREIQNRYWTKKAEAAKAETAKAETDSTKED